MIEFGTGGWREIIGDQFTKENIRKIATALVKMTTKNTIILGYDRRFLSREAAHWFCEVLAAHKINALLIDKASPTPVIMFAVKQYQAEFGVAITASHNPAVYNGIKVFTFGGRDATVEVTQQLASIANDITSTKALTSYELEESEYFKRIDPFNDYIDSILSTLNVVAIRQAHLKIVVDPMHGVSKTSLTTILATTRCEIDTIHERHDTLFGGKLPSPSAATLHRLMDIVRENKYDLGIATDGDADRIGIVDSKGNFIHPNTLIALLYFYLLEYKKWHGAVIRNLSTTHLLDRIAKAYGETCIETPVGFKYISENMEKHDAIIGGESSGGLTVKGHIFGKDGIFAASLLVEMMSVTKKPIHILVQELEEKFGKSVFSENAYRFTLTKKERLLKRLFEEKAIPDYQDIESAYYLDGLKIHFKDDSWISARFSGTEPVLRIFAEAFTEQQCRELVEKMEQFLDLTEKEKI